MNFLLSSDDNYAPLLGVTVYSLLENNYNDFNEINIFVLDMGISKKNKSKLHSICQNFKTEVNLHFIKSDNIEGLFGIKIKATRALATYARLFSCTLLDDNIDKIIYLDCDAIVDGSFKELSKLNIDDYYCAGVLDAGPEYINSFLNLPEGNDHFNAGFLLINLKKWREDNLEDKFLDYVIENNGEVFHNDQGVINVICRDKILKIDPKYNLLSPFFEVDYYDVLKWYGMKKYYSREIVEDALKNPVFIHLTQFVHGRPWFTNASNHPLRKQFDYYAVKTPFKNEVYVEDNRHLRGKLFSFTYRILPFSVICFMFSVFRFSLIKKHKIKPIKKI